MKIFSKIANYLLEHKKLAVLLIIFVVHVFFRFYLLEERLDFGLDQSENAWVAKSIVVDNRYPLLGMVAKGNSGFNIGPLYYYFVAIIYWIFNLNPIASGSIAGITSVFAFFVLFFVAKKLFNYNVAIIAVGINTVSFFIIANDRIQWPVNLIAPISFLVFYALYNVLIGKVKYLLLLALAVGISFHIHFTSIFYPIIILLSLPFFPRSKQTIKYILLSIPVFLIFLTPHIIAEIFNNNSQANNLISYLGTYYQGFHLTRILQLTNDAFIEFQLILRGWSMNMSYLLVIIFYGVYFFLKPTKKKFLMSYLIGLWFIVPWLVFATYKGEISNYYFFSTRPIVLVILAYLTYKIFSLKNYLFKVIVMIFWFYFSYVNVVQFFIPEVGGLGKAIVKTKKSIMAGEIIKEYPHSPESYLYYYLTKKGTNKL